MRSHTRNIAHHLAGSNRAYGKGGYDQPFYIITQVSSKNIGKPGGGEIASKTKRFQPRVRQPSLDNIDTFSRCVLDKVCFSIRRGFVRVLQQRFLFHRWRPSLEGVNHQTGDSWRVRSAPASRLTILTMQPAHLSPTIFASSQFCNSPLALDPLPLFALLWPT